jgi:hypothetical protein
MSFALLLASGILVELLKKRLGIGVKKQLGWCLIAICGNLFCAFFCAYISSFWWPSRLEVEPKASRNNENLNTGDGVDLLDLFHYTTNAPGCAWKI